VIDPDEEFITDNSMNPEKLWNHLRNNAEGIDAIGLEAIDYRPSSKRVAARFDSLRFFRNGAVTWHRRVHNQPEFKGKAVLLKNAQILHCGYDLTLEQRQAKANRTISLLKLTLEENPNDYESMFYLAQAYGAFLDDRENALLWGKRYIEHRSEIAEKFNTSIYHLVAAICAHKKLEDKCYDYIERGLNEDPWDIDLLMDMMQYALRKNDRTVLVTAAQKFILCYDNFSQYRFKHPGKFFFNYNLSSYSSALFYAATNMIENGASIYRRLQETTPKLPPDAKKEIEQKFNELLDKINFRDLSPVAVVAPSAASPALPAYQIPQNLELPAL
jgi:hypothetical protein